MTRAWMYSFLVSAWAAPLLWPQPAFDPAIPKTWDEQALADWATPLAGLNARPSHISSKEYYSLPVENLRTYPVYFPGREPEGYWDMLLHMGPRPLIEPEKLKTRADWVAAGRRVFDEADMIHERVFDPTLIESARRAETFREAGTQPLPDGTLYFLRWRAHTPRSRLIARKLQQLPSPVSKRWYFGCQAHPRSRARHGTHGSGIHSFRRSTTPAAS